MQEKLTKVDAKVDNFKAQVGALDLKLDLVLKSPSKIKPTTHSQEDNKKQLDQLISL